MYSQIYPLLLNTLIKGIEINLHRMNIISKYTLLSLTILMFSSCSKEQDALVDGDGQINALFSADNTVKVSTRESLNDGEAIAPEINDFTLSLTNQAGTYQKTWDKISDYDPTTKVPVGTYDVTISYGKLEDEGFEKPYYLGTTQTTVMRDQTSSPTINATLANTMVNIKYTDAFKKYFTDYKATIHSEGGMYVEFAKDESRSAYVRPGTIALNFTVKKTTGKEGTFEVASIENAKARTLYNVTVDVNNGEIGQAKIVITFDEKTIEEPITLDISDDILSAPAPSIEVIGFNEGTAVSVFEGDNPTESIQMQLKALGGLKAVTLTTQCSSLEQAGWASEYNLINVDSETQTMMESKFGLHPTGLWKNPDKYANIDFTKLLSHISTGGTETTAKFTIQVKDNYSRVSDPVTLDVNVTPLILSLVNAEKQAFGIGYAVITYKYNGPDFTERVSFEAKDAYGVYGKCTVSKVQDLGSNVYSMRLSLPQLNATNSVRVVYKENVQEGKDFTIAVGEAIYTIVAKTGYTGSNFATISIDSDYKAQSSVITKNIKVFIKADGQTEYTMADVVRDEEDNSIKITNLQPSTTYSIKGLLITGGIYSNEITITTTAY